MGGESLRDAFARLAQQGTIVTFGASAQQPTTFEVPAFYRRQATLVGFLVFPDLRQHGSGSADLAYLAGLVASGELDVGIDLVLPWTEATEAVGPCSSAGWRARPCSPSAEAHRPRRGDPAGPGHRADERRGVS